MSTNDFETTRIRLSTLWIVVMFNYLYADVIGFFVPEMIEGILARDMGGIEPTQMLFLGSALLMEVPILMVLASRTLGYTANRWANIITGVLYTGVTLVTLFGFETPPPYYIFFGTVEVAITVLIAWHAWKWLAPEPLAVPAP